MCSASTVIAAECDHKMQEADSGIIEHTEFDPDTVERMISYVYKQTYDLPGDLELSIPVLPRKMAGGQDEEPTQSLEGINAKLVAHARVYGIGDFYDLPTLKLFARNKFVNAAGKDWSLGGFIEVVKAVHLCTGTTDRALREALRFVAMDHAEQLAEDDTFMTDLAELEDVQDFAADMLRQLVRHHTVSSILRAHEVTDLIEAQKELNFKLEALQEDYARKEEHMQSRIDKLAKEKAHSEQTTQTLIDALEDLPSECTSKRCDREFGALRFEQKGHSTYGPGMGDWAVRCKKCNARLIR